MTQTFRKYLEQELQIETKDKVVNSSLEDTFLQVSEDLKRKGKYSEAKNAAEIALNLGMESVQWQNDGFNIPPQQNIPNLELIERTADDFYRSQNYLQVPELRDELNSATGNQRSITYGSGNKRVIVHIEKPIEQARGTKGSGIDVLVQSYDQ